MQKLFLSGLVLVAACSEGTRPQAWTVTDSAEAQIVTSDRTPPLQWSLGEPRLQLGTVSGGPTEFYQIRDLLLLSDGGIVVGNGGTNEVRIFNADGSHRTTFGSTGRGPGELDGLTMVRALGDSLATYDSRNDRVTVFGPTGKYGRSFRLEWTAGLLGPEDIVPGIGVLSSQGTHMVDLEHTGLNTDTSVVSLHDLEGRLVAPLAELEHNSRVVRRNGDRQTTLRAPLSAYAAFIGLESGFCHSFGPSVEVRCFDWTGELDRVLRLDEPARRVAQADIDRYVELSMESTQGDRPGLRTMLAEMPYPDLLPAFDDLLADRAGQVWARRYRVDPDAAETWSVFGIGGELVAELRVPEGVHILYVGPDEVLARWRDELDVEYVMAIPLIAT